MNNKNKKQIRDAVRKLRELLVETHDSIKENHVWSQDTTPAHVYAVILKETQDLTKEEFTRVITGNSHSIVDPAIAIMRGDLVVDTTHTPLDKKGREIKNVQ
jgi:DNA-binding transcriptional regulator GbsR (MarR family)|tara:strand:- start:1424 stop:1729 length:306 start_codon:yes stop_codon:yes gene_type:complete